MVASNASHGGNTISTAEGLECQCCGRMERKLVKLAGSRIGKNCRNNVLYALRYGTEALANNKRTQKSCMDFIISHDLIGKTINPFTYKVEA